VRPGTASLTPQQGLCVDEVPCVRHIPIPSLLHLGCRVWFKVAAYVTQPVRVRMNAQDAPPSQGSFS
jgi:hypothetical protein